MKKILILEGEKPAAYAAARSLFFAGFQITAASSLSVNLCRSSRYVKSFIRCPEPDSQPGNFIRWLTEETKRGCYETIFSFSDKTTRVLSENKKELSSYTNIYQPSIEIVETALNKSKTYQLATSLGMNVPERFDITGKNIEEIEESVKFPFVLRPKQKIFYVNGKAKYYKVTALNYFMNEYDLKKKIHLFSNELDKFEALQYIRGAGRGYFSVIKDNKTYGDFAHERIREYPITGGASTFRKSIAFEEIKHISMPLIRALHWFGPIMIEYKYDPENKKYYLLEINGRWWGSLPLAIHAGVDFPIILMQLMANDRSSQASSANFPYKINFTSRLLLPHDIMSFLSCLLNGKFSQLPGFFKPADKEDIFDWRDSGAYFGYLISLLGQLKLLRY